MSSRPRIQIIADIVRQLVALARSNEIQDKITLLTGVAPLEKSHETIQAAEITKLYLELQENGYEPPTTTELRTICAKSHWLLTYGNYYINKVIETHDNLLPYVKEDLLRHKLQTAQEVANKINVACNNYLSHIGSEAAKDEDPLIGEKRAFFKAIQTLIKNNQNNPEVAINAIDKKIDKMSIAEIKRLSANRDPLWMVCLRDIFYALKNIFSDSKSNTAATTNCHAYKRQSHFDKVFTDMKGDVQYGKNSVLKK
jgi:hypothetical protein